MRRFFSILMILLLGLGPLAATLPASAESRLPACCRRHGTHHCTMTAETAARASKVSSESGAGFTSPLHCPNFPSSAAASTTPVHALDAIAARFPVPFAEAHSPAANRGTVRMIRSRVHTNRGPPAFRIA